MTKQDYELIAAVYAHALGEAARFTAQNPSDAAGHAVYAAHVRTAQDMALMLATQNPRFNKARFLTACGVSA